MNRRGGSSCLLQEMVILWAQSTVGGVEKASVPKVSSRNISAKAVGCTPSTFSGKPVMLMLFHLNLFSRSSVLSLRLSFSLDRAKQVDLRVANLVSMSLREVFMC